MNNKIIKSGGLPLPRKWVLTRETTGCDSKPYNLTIFRVGCRSCGQQKLQVMTTEYNNSLVRTLEGNCSLACLHQLQSHRDITLLSDRYYCNIPGGIVQRCIAMASYYVDIAAFLLDQVVDHIQISTPVRKMVVSYYNQ